MANDFNRNTPTNVLYTKVQEYLLDAKKQWQCMPMKDKRGYPDRVLFLGVPGGQIRFFLDYKSNPYKFSRSDLVIHFLMDATYVPMGYFYNIYGKEDSLVGLVRNLDTNKDAVYYKELFIDTGGLRELAESVYVRVYERVCTELFSK